MKFDLLYELYRTLENQDDYLEHNDFSLENCDFSLENCDFSLENCDFSLENNDFSLENNDDSLMNNENSLMNNENSLMNNENSLMKNENSLMIDDDSLLSSHWKLSFPRCSASLPFYSLWYKTFVVIKAAKLEKLLDIQCEKENKYFRRDLGMECLISLQSLTCAIRLRA